MAITICMSITRSARFGLSCFFMTLVLLLTACGGASHNVPATSSATASVSAVTSSTATSANLSSVRSGLVLRPLNAKCIAPLPISDSASVNIAWEPAFPSLPNASAAISLLQAPNNNDDWYLVRQSGRILRFSNKVDANSFTQVLNIEDRVTSGGELGLLGMVFHPEFARNSWVYVNYTARTESNNLETRIARLKMMSDGVIDSTSELILLRFNQPYSNHNGGQLAFGRDGYLYIATGDGGSGGDPQQHGQNLHDFLGKILRIDVNNSTPALAYGIPADNPFVLSEGLDEIWAYGLRNPWRFSFDRETQALWVGDVGQGAWEEINVVERGGNYGWGDMEGEGCYSGRANCSPANKVLPLLAISHNEGVCSVIGGYVYRGSQYPAAYGKYFFGDYCDSSIQSISRPQSGGVVRAQHGNTMGNMVSFAEDNQGELYALTQSGAGSQIIKLKASGGVMRPGLMAPQLSATGCVDEINPQLAANVMIPYNVQSPLWSDGAVKTRFLALPDNSTVTLLTDGDFIFPRGSVLMKHFMLNNRFIETRLFAYGELGWQGFSYEWRDDQSDADLLAGGKEKMSDGLLWQYPSPGQCLQCHTFAANYALGLETLQLNGELLYPNGVNANQLDSLQHINIFMNRITPQQKSQALAPLNKLDVNIAQRARSYLHTNCSGCHRPGGTTPVALDLRFDTDLGESYACDVTPAVGDLGISNAKIIAHGAPERSVLLARMNLRDQNQMPPLGTHLVDLEATTLIERWISALDGCN